MLNLRIISPTLTGLLLLSISSFGYASEKETIVKEIVICSGGQCAPANNNSTNDLFETLEQLLKANENEKVPMCEADPSNRICQSKKICHFVLGGIIPGNGCSKSLTFTEISRNDQAQQLTMKGTMPLTFIGTPLKCVAAPGLVIVHSTTDISLQLKPHFCSWMVVNAMSAQLNMKIEYINLDRGEIGGYWQHSVKGTGNGSGSGYFLLAFPKSLAIKSTDFTKQANQTYHAN